jgi:phosphatidylinositol alpha-1,6-mannosyltransferase
MAVLSGMGPALMAAGICARRGVPYAVIGHGMEFTGSSGVRAGIFRRACNHASVLISVSRYTQALADQAGVTPAACEVIPNGADDAFFRRVDVPARWRDQRGLAAGPLLLTTGRVCERKGQDVVVRAVARLSEAHPDLQYAAVGLAPGGERLGRLAASLGVASLIHVPGPVPKDDLPFWYSAADLFVLMSRPSADGDVEGYGIVVVEAALCGTPAVVSDHGGLPEAVAGGETGWVVPAEDDEALADRLADLLQNPGRVKAAGRTAMDRAKTSGAWRHRVARYDQVLRSTLGACRS